MLDMANMIVYDCYMITAVEGTIPDGDAGIRGRNGRPLKTGSHNCTDGCEPLLVIKGIHG